MPDSIPVSVPLITSVFIFSTSNYFCIHFQYLLLLLYSFSDLLLNSSRKWLTYTGTSAATAPWRLSHNFAELILWFQQKNLTHCGRYWSIAPRKDFSSSVTMGYWCFPCASHGNSVAKTFISFSWEFLSFLSWIKKMTGITG